MHQPRFQGRNLRVGRFSEPGRIYHVTTTTHHRQPVFDDFHQARRLIKVLRRTEHNDDASTLAFVVMPDHLHWLLQLGDMVSLSRVVGAMKSVSAHGAGRRLWQAGFHDHALRKEEDLLGLTRYIVANPLRAGLVSHIGDYPHWDCIWL